MAFSLVLVLGLPAEHNRGLAAHVEILAAHTELPAARTGILAARTKASRVFPNPNHLFLLPNPKPPVAALIHQVKTCVLVHKRSYFD